MKGRAGKSAGGKANREYRRNLGGGFTSYKVHLQKKKNPPENIFKREQIPLWDEPSTDHGPERSQSDFSQQSITSGFGWKKTTSSEAFQDGRAIELTWNHSKKKQKQIDSGSVGLWCPAASSSGSSSSSCFLSPVNSLAGWLPLQMLWVSWMNAQQIQAAASFPLLSEELKREVRFFLLFFFILRGP